MPCPALHYSTHQAAAPPVPPPAGPAHEWLCPRRRRALRFLHGPAELSLSAGCGGAAAAESGGGADRTARRRRCGPRRPPLARSSPAGLSTAQPGPAQHGTARPEVRQRSRSEAALPRRGAPPDGRRGSAPAPVPAPCGSRSAGRALPGPHRARRLWALLPSRARSARSLLCPLALPSFPVLFCFVFLNLIF